MSQKKVDAYKAEKANREKIMKIIALHGGMRGFDIPGAIFVITGDLRLYQNEYERNTLFVDGGIFLMNLLYALDYFCTGFLSEWT